MEELGKRMDAAEQQIQALREDLNRRFDQLVEMIRKGVPLLPMMKNHQRMVKMLSGEEREVILEQKHLNHILFSVPQEGQLMMKFLKMKKMMRALKNLTSMHIQEYPTLRMRGIHTR
jgi:hypothetical protein